MMRLLPVLCHGKVKPLEDSEANSLTVVTGAWRESIYGKDVKIQLWRLLGSNIRFICGGRLIIGQGWNVLYFIYIVVQMLGILTVFGWFEIWPYITSFEYVVFTSLHLFIGLYAVLNVFYAVSVDPGILAPSIHDPVKDDLTIQQLNEISRFDDRVYDTMIHALVDIDGKLEERYYCVDCNAFREYRTYHCSICNVCVERYDHHCSILGTCIGRRNYGYFLKFIWSTTFSIVGIVIYSTINFITLWIKEGFTIACAHSPTDFAFLATLVFPPCGTAIMFSIAFSHLRLVWSDQTLLESKYNIEGDATPFENYENTCQAICDRLSTVCRAVCTKPSLPRTRLHTFVYVKALPRNNKIFTSKKAIIDHITNIGEN